MQNQTPSHSNSSTPNHSRQASISDQGWPSRSPSSRPSPVQVPTSPSRARPVIENVPHNHRLATTSRGLMFYHNGPQRTDSMRKVEPRREHGYNILSPPKVDPSEPQPKQRGIRTDYAKSKSVFSNEPDPRSLRPTRRQCPPPKTDAPPIRKKAITAPWLDAPAQTKGK